MTVIRTSVKRRLAKASFPFILTAVAASTVLYAGTSGSVASSPSVDSLVNMNSFAPEEEQILPTDENVNDDVTEDVFMVSETFVQEEESNEPACSFLKTVNMSTEQEDLTLFTVHSGAISEVTFGRGSGPEYIELENNAQVRNCTDISNETVVKKLSDISNIVIDMYSEDPQVLIMHTHTTESYEPYIKSWYDERYSSRSFDPDNGVVAVGEAIAESLAKEGIAVVHDCTIHDSQYNGAYTRSLDATLDMMSKYPSIKIVLDIHRDAIEYDDGTRVSAVTEINGRKAAQVMIICAADDGTYGVPDFYDNLHFACGFQSSMEDIYPTLTRPVLFQYCQYNQQVSSGALLIEVGSHGNSVDEAVYSGELIGNALAVFLKKISEEEKPNAVQVLADVPMYFFERLR